ncbi:UNKNOWN [Stylonychia lemnae]|uniref:carbonic anhydrase n=1 Tax=Stylonychia lemnae TaxID=5949 RepID=A0A078A508_STYLE|nr:UNKNOWN [Stylonychia lemnae]|eukprot:CDW77350.1 UNKNOWN [Stylonychia lemnae]
MFKGKLLSLSTLFIALISSVQSAIHYNQGGSDWTGTCATGKSQSPVDIPVDNISGSSINSKYFRSNKLLDIMVSQKSMSNITLQDNIYTYQYSFSDGYLAFWDENDSLQTFQLLQFHVHAPSEHTFNGQYYDVEVHFVHKHTTENRLVAFSVLFDTKAGGDKENEFIKSMSVGAQNQSVISTLPAMNLFKKLDMNQLYHYEGSLTTPPCNEIVSWIIVHDPQQISSAQVKAFNDKWKNNQTFAAGKGNNRGIQNLNQRLIYKKDDPRASNGVNLIASILPLFVLLFGFF